MTTTELMTAAAVVAGVLAAVAGSTTLRRTRGRRPLVVAAMTAGAVGLTLGLVLVVTIGAIWIRGVNSHFFAAAHVLYLGLVISVPILGLWLLVEVARRRLPVLVAALAVVLLIPVPAGWYATHWAPYALLVVPATVDLPPERAGTRPIRIGVLADLQTNAIGSYERRVIRVLEAQKPDLIVIPGDLFQGNQEQFFAILPHYRALLRSLDAPYGVYAVPGDSETVDRLMEITAGTGITILDNRIVTLRIGDRTLLLGGNKLRWAPDDAKAIRTTLTQAPPAAVRVLVAHRPEVVLGLPPDSGMDLVIAGHTHGGQVALPFLGPVVKASPVSRRVAGGGLHEVAGNPIYVSSGAGIVRQQAPQVRFLTRPSVGLVTLD